MTRFSIALCAYSYLLSSFIISLSGEAPAFSFVKDVKDHNYFWLLKSYNAFVHCCFATLTEFTTGGPLPLFEGKRCHDLFEHAGKHLCNTHACTFL